MVRNTLPSKVNTDHCCCIDYLHFVTYILERNTIIMPVFVQLDITVFHNLNLKVFFQFPTLLGQWFQMSPFDVLKQIIAAFFPALKRKVIMYLQKLKDGFIKFIKACEHTITKWSKNACINDLNHSLYPCLVTWFTAAGRKDSHTVMIAQIKKIPINIRFVTIGLVNSGFKIIRNQNIRNSSVVV